MTRSGRFFLVGAAPIALGCMPPSVFAQAPTSGWQGHYKFESDSGGTAVRYDLTIGPGGERGCLLSSQSGDASEVIVCHASGDDRKLVVAFHRYPDGRLVNKSGVAAYKPEQTLFALEKPADGGGLTTAWEALRPDEKAPSRGQFFAKVE